MPALAKRNLPADEAAASPASPADVAVALARGVVLDLELRDLAARAIAEEIDAAIRPVVYGATQDDAAARERLAELRGDAERVRAEIGDLAVAVTEARERLASAEQAQREGNEQAILDHARSLADQFIEQSQLIDDALATIVAAHAERRRLASAIVASGCLHPSRYSWLDCPTRMACALAVAGASPIASPGQPPSTGKVFAIHTLARSDRETLSNLAVANRNSRSSF